MRSATATVEGLNLHYRHLGEGPPVLLLHGWPTSSLLWRGVMPGIAAQGRRAVALDLPGFGQSDKPLDASYSFRFYERILDGFVDHLGAEAIGLAVHDLGGPLGLYWATRRPERLERLAILNTLVYPEMSWAVMVFVLGVKLPGARHWLTSPGGLRFAMRLGVYRPERLGAEVFDGIVAPFASASARRALAKAGCGLHPGGFRELSTKLRELSCPVQIIYGDRDRILPDIAKTVRRLRQDLPQAEVTSFGDCGHFLQEERPTEIGAALGDHFAATARSSPKAE